MKKIISFTLFFALCIVYPFKIFCQSKKGYYKISNSTNASSREVHKDSCLIIGQLFDALTKEPIVYGWIKVKDTKISVETDTLGNFSLKVPLGKFKLIAASNPNIEITTRTIKFDRYKSYQIDFYLGIHVIY